ncbi:hypothetical protein [Streptomyces sp. NPDC094468]|uniref:hypothetical protein n=1 Tax=Streptomyces sp. NPDC094468 TaxID=3366066 RepID=UPI00380A9F4B
MNHARLGQTSADALASASEGAALLRRAMTEGDLRYAGATLAVHRMYDEMVSELSQTRRGRVALRLACAWAAVSLRVKPSRSTR